MLVNLCRLSLTCVAIYFTSLASTNAAIVVHNIESTGGFTLDRFSPTSELNIPINLKITMDNGGAAIESQTWGLNDLISIEISIPSQSFTFFRDTSDFTYSWRVNSLLSADDSFSRFRLITDATGAIVSRDMLVYYDNVGTPNDNGTPTLPDDDFIGYAPPAFVFTPGNRYLSQTGGTLPNFAAGLSFTESLVVTAVPEPTSMVMMGFGSLLFCFSRRRK